MNTLFNKAASSFQTLINKSYFPYILLVISGFFIYISSVFYGYTYMDDNALILNNLSYLGDASNIIIFFTEGVFKHSPGINDIYYRPLQTVSYMLDTIISGGSLKVYHLSNVLLHLLNVCLLFILLRKIGTGKIAAFVPALFFCVQPALSGAVAWLPGRVDILLSVFTLSSFIFLIKYLERNSIAFLAGNVGFFILALFTKETAIVIPLAFVLYILLVYKKEEMENFKFISFPLTPARLGIFMLLWGISIAAYFMIRNAALPSSETSATNIPAMFSNTLRNIPAFTIYLGKAFLPFNLSTYPSTEFSGSAYGIISVFIVLLIIGLTSVKCIMRSLFGLVWFFLFLLPSLVSEFAYLPESRMYLPLTGVILIISSLIENPRKIVISTAYIRDISSVCFVIILSVFTFQTVSQSKKYKDDVSFWKDASEHSPAYSLIHLRLGQAWLRNGNFSSAEEEYLDAYKINPEQQFLLSSITELYLEKNEPANAEYFIEQDMDKLSKGRYFNYMGQLYYNAGRGEEAVIRWKKAIDTDPMQRDAYISLARYQIAHKNYDYARWLADKLILLDPSFQDAHEMLAQINAERAIKDIDPN